MNPFTFFVVLLLQAIRLVLMTAMGLAVTAVTLVVAPFWAIYRMWKPKQWKYDPNKDA